MNRFLLSVFSLALLVCTNGVLAWQLPDRVHAPYHSGRYYHGDSHSYPVEQPYGYRQGTSHRPGIRIDLLLQHRWFQKLSDILIQEPSAARIRQTGIQAGIPGVSRKPVSGGLETPCCFCSTGYPTAFAISDRIESIVDL